MGAYFNDNLKYIRKIKKVSQQELADKIGVDRSTISYWENGMEITLTNAIKIAEALDVPFPEFVGTDLKVINNLELDKKHNLDYIIMDKTKTLSEDDKKKIIDIIDVYNK